MKERDKKRMQPFRNRLLQLRTEQGLSLRELSQKCDVDHAKINKLESNVGTNLTLTTLFEIAKGLGVHPKELIDYPFEFLEEKEKL